MDLARFPRFGLGPSACICPSGDTPIGIGGDGCNELRQRDVGGGVQRVAFPRFGTHDIFKSRKGGGLRLDPEDTALNFRRVPLFLQFQIVPISRWARAQIPQDRMVFGHRFVEADILRNYTVVKGVDQVDVNMMNVTQSIFNFSNDTTTTTSTTTTQTEIMTEAFKTCPQTGLNSRLDAYCNLPREGPELCNPESPYWPGCVCGPTFVSPGQTAKPGVTTLRMECYLV